MDVEKTIEYILSLQTQAEQRRAESEARQDRAIEYILDMQAKADERHRQAMERADRADRRLDRLEHIVALMVRTGRPLRTDVRELEQWREEMRHWQKKTERNLAEITEKLDALIHIVDNSIRGNGNEGAAPGSR